jgi:hypothetical protein
MIHDDNNTVHALFSLSFSLGVREFFSAARAFDLIFLI